MFDYPSAWLLDRDGEISTLWQSGDTPVYKLESSFDYLLSYNPWNDTFDFLFKGQTLGSNITLIWGQNVFPGFTLTSLEGVSPRIFSSDLQLGIDYKLNNFRYLATIAPFPGACYELRFLESLNSELSATEHWGIEFVFPEGLDTSVYGGTYVLSKSEIGLWKTEKASLEINPIKDLVVLIVYYEDTPLVWILPLLDFDPLGINDLGVVVDSKLPEHPAIQAKIVPIL